MICLSRSAAFVAGFSVAVVISQSVWAQNQGRGRGFGAFGNVSELQLAQLDSVQKALNLTDEQKTKVETLNDELRTKTREAFQNANGDFAKVREEMAKLRDEYGKKFNELLDESQKTRARGIYVQANGPSSLLDEPIASEIGITDEQKQKLQKVNEDTFAKMRDLRDLDGEERREKFGELIESRDKELLAVLTDEQKEQFEKMKGEKIEIDRSQLFQRRGR